MERTAAVVLGAGLARRFGGGKMLALLDGSPMLQHVLDLVASVGLEPVIVILGDDAAAIERTLAWRNERGVLNPNPASGVSGSVRLGLAELADSDVERAVVLLGDQPRLSAEQLSALVSVPGDVRRPIVVPRFAGRPGNPVLLERPAWNLAAELRGDRGMSQLFHRRPDLVRYVEMPGENPDIDTPEDLLAVSRGEG
jgi:molybdenum cofactor cytidylyltransferase